jgi:hypothetical protein
MKNPVIRVDGSELKEGCIVYNQGFEFVATEIEIIKLENGSRVAYYKGTCTDSPRNKSIARTGFNGGRYSIFLGRE